MHGTFRGSVAGRAGPAVRFDAPVLSGTAGFALLQGKRTAKLAALLTGCCLALLPTIAPPSHSSGAAQPPVRQKRGLPPAADFGVAIPAAALTLPHRPAPAPVRRSRLIDSPADGVSLAEATEPANIPTLAIEPLPAPVMVVDLPAPSPPAQLAAVEPAVVSAAIEIAHEPSAEALRPVDIAQVSDSEVRSLRIPQLHELGLAAGSEPDLTARIAAMQITPLPAPRLRDSDRDVLLAEAPTRMNVLIGKAALGKVDFRMTETRTIDVKLSGLLDLLAGHYDATEFARLRTSAAADAYVSFDQLRALGLNLRYDPVYDELRISG